MAIRIITYDLKNGDIEDYDDLREAIEEYEHCDMQKSVYVIDTTESNGKVFEKLKVHLKKNDRLFVCRLKKDWSNRGKCSDWLKSDDRTW
jgi:virulence-associated protein VapD